LGQGSVCTPDRRRRLDGVGFETELERELAALLANLLHGADWWATFDQRPNDPVWRDAMGDKAVALYRLTGPMFERVAWMDEQASESLVSAFGSIWEIADACALRSELWPESDNWERAILTREQIEVAIRLTDVPEWADELGEPLELRLGPDLLEQGVPESMWGEGWGESAWDADLPTAVANTLEAYSMLLNLRETLDEAGMKQALAMLSSDKPDYGEQHRLSACRGIAYARWWVSWSRGHVEGEQGVTAATVAYLISHALFVQSREFTSACPLYPSKETAAAMLRESGAVEWLREEGADLPDWV
jgi:hypothetical protein